jgi:cytochrome oxidase Cu insertion factor (SCO1/SenC/PrrC family)
VTGRTDGMSRAATRMRLAALIIVLGGLACVSLAFVAYVAAGGTGQAGSASSNLHGQAGWSPGERLAPSFSLRDQSGRLVSLAAQRGRPVLLTFFDSRCEDQCPLLGHQFGTMLRNLDAAERPTLLIVSVNPLADTPRSIRQAMAAWRLAGPWRWHWLRGSQRELARVWGDYGITVEPTTNAIAHGLVVYLIDRRGFQRTGYLFPLLPNFVARDLRTLSRE